MAVCHPLEWEHGLSPPHHPHIIPNKGRMLIKKHISLFLPSLYQICTSECEHA